MNEIKIDKRIENAMNAFFETEIDQSRFALTYTGPERLVAPDATTFTERADKWSGIGRELLMFGPGTFALFYLTLTLVFFYPSIGLSFQGLFMLFSAVFLTYAGSGNIKKLKNLAVPGTVITIALVVALISSLFPGEEQANLYFWYSIYLFPNVLIAAKLVQSWLSDK